MRPRLYESRTASSLVTRRVQTEAKLVRTSIRAVRERLSPCAVRARASAFEQPSGETCTGLAVHDGELVLSFAGKEGRRVPRPASLRGGSFHLVAGVTPGPQDRPHRRPQRRSHVPASDERGSSIGLARNGSPTVDQGIQIVTDHKHAADPIPIYCINLPEARERRARMTRQFEHFGLLDRAHFVRAVPHRSSKVDEHLARIGIVATDHQSRAVAACWLSHVRALRTFLREQPSSTAACIVLEDDVLLHCDWPDRLEAVLANLPESAPVCTLGYNDEDWIRPYESWEGFAWSGRQPKLKNLTAVLTRQWGAHAYWISRWHAREVLHHAESGTALPSLIPAYVPQGKSAPGARGHPESPGCVLGLSVPRSPGRHFLIHP